MDAARLKASCQTVVVGSGHNGLVAAAYLARADAMQKQGRYDDAVAALTHAMELLPQEKGTLQAKRSLVQLEAARAKAPGKLTGTEPLVTA